MANIKIGTRMSLSEAMETVNTPTPKIRMSLSDALKFDESLNPDRKQADFTTDLLTPKRSLFQRTGKLAAEAAKGTVRGFENIAGGIGATVVWLGENIKENKILDTKLERSVNAKVGGAITRWGKEAHRFWRDEANKGFEAPDPNIFRGSFMENPSWTRGVAIIAESVPSLAAATAVTFATGNPVAGAASLGLIEGSGQYIEAREAGKSVKFSSGVGALSTAGNTVLEIIPLTRFLKGGKKKLIKDIFIGAGQEGTEEVLQALWTNLIARVGYDKTRDLTQGMVEGFIGGAGSGGLIGGFTSGRGMQVDEIAKEAIEKGATTQQIEQMQEAVQTQIVTNADAVEEALSGEPVVAPEVIVEEAEVLEKKQIVEAEAIVERIQEIQEKFVRPETIAKKEVKAVQEEIIKGLEQSGLEAKDKAKFIRTIKNIQTAQQLTKALPEIQERVTRFTEVAQKKTLTREITRISKANVDVEYRQEIDGILESFDLKNRTEATKNRREKKQAFLERQREEGNLDFLPPDFFTDFGKTTLDEMTLEEVEALRDQIQVLSTVGATKSRLLAARGERDFQARITNVVGKMYARAGTTEQFEGDAGPVVSNKNKGFFDRARDIIDNFFAAHRKVEFILRTLDNQPIFEIIQDGINNELSDTEKAYVKLKDAFKLISKNLNTMSSKDVTIKDVPVTLTREQMIGVALNNGNRGNRQRLINGNKFNLDEITAIEKALKPNERKFVEQIFEIINEQFPKTVEVSKKLVGISPRKVIGKYFPIVADRELNKQAKFNAAKRDLFQDIFHITFVERGFTKAREGGRAPVNLNVFNVIFSHIDSVIHYNSMAIPTRDMQKIINNPRFTKAVTDIMGEAVNNQFSPWLRDIANPSNLTASTSMDKIFQFLRHNATAAILGHRLTVSLLQGGSFTQTINEIGLKDSINGIVQFYKKPRRSIEFVYSQSPFMKNRSQTFDREVKDWLKSSQAKKITQGKKSWGEILFVMIRGIDFLTTMPTWIGAYEKNLAQTQNVEESARLADGVARRTQPSAAMENLSAIMRGSATQKLFTSFMTHFSNMHNQMVFAMDELKYSKEHSLRKSENFARAMWWLWIAPALLAGWIRSGFKVEDWRKFAQELTLYPFAGMFLIRDIMNAVVKGFDFGSPPGLAAFRETQLTFQSKSGQKKLKHGVKAVGLFTGKIPTQWVDSVDGFIDLSNEETQDFRRLIWGESAIDPVKRGIFAPRKSKSGSPAI